jgi:UDP:flavonoid glycosyltransferase YjiC (YdhE family)
VQAGRFFESAIEACQRLDSRGILLTRHKSAIPSSLPEGIRHFNYVPFSMILSQSSAFVHHGGIGTIAQGLAAGVPQLAIPMIMDQPDNAVRLERLGVGTYLVPGKFQASALADKLDHLMRSPEVVAQCAKYSNKLASTSALDLTCTLIEGLAHRT